jgi:hypothetical protein
MGAVCSTQEEIINRSKVLEGKPEGKKPLE